MKLTNQNLIFQIGFLLISFMNKRQYCLGDERCNAGQFYNTTSFTCTTCTDNTYCGLYDICENQCNECPVNTLPDLDHSTCASGVCDTCPRGSYCPSGDGIYGCPVGTYGDREGLYTVDQCIKCLKGQYANSTNSTTCQNCSQGTYSSIDGGVLCRLCEEGKYQTGSGMIICEDCERGTYQTGLGMDSRLNCSYCSSGTYGTGTGMIVQANCTNCGQGTYSTGYGMIGNCSLCKVGTYSVEYGASSSSVCVSCEEGKFQSEEGSYTCSLCPLKTYLDEQGSNSSLQCKGCPEHTLTLSTGSTNINDCICEEGYAGLNGGPNCFACSPGSYADNQQMGACKLCPADTYDSNDENTPRSVVEVCQSVPMNGYAPNGSITYYCNAGFYKNGPALSCEICEINTYQYAGDFTECQACVNGHTNGQKMSGSIEDCRCNTGFYKSNNASDCEVCPIGYYCPGGYVDKQQCKSGRNTSGMGMSSFEECICVPGFYGNANLDIACEICPEYHYCPGNLSNSPSIDCPTNTYSALGSHDIYNCYCMAGYSSPNASRGVACSLCEANTFCLSGQKSSCRPYSNTIANTTATSQENCSCIPGFYSVNSTSECLECPVDAYCMGGTHFMNCSTNFTTFGNKQARNGTACSCRHGYFYSASDEKCYGCPESSYCSGGNVTYTTCVANAWAPAFNVFMSQCTCNEGYAGSYVGCTPCVAGTYTVQSNSSECTKCRAGTYSPLTMQTSISTCLDCEAGTWSSGLGAPSILSCNFCQSGKYSTSKASVDSTVCAYCGLGQYSSALGSNSSLSCSVCSGGTYSTSLGLTQSTDCTPCGKGYYSSRLGAINASTCEGCMPGKYSIHEIATSNATCSLCEAGTWSTTFAAADSNSCIACEKGSYSTSQGSYVPCTECRQGSYNPTEGASSATACELCGLGTFSTATKATSSSTCVLCRGGTYNMKIGSTNIGDCLSCVRGKFSSGLGATSVLQCEDCAVGTYNDMEGATNSTESCVKCREGTYSVVSGSTSSGTCLACAAGTLSTGRGMGSLTTCTACSPGSYSWIGASSCTYCYGGTVLRRF